MPQFSPLEDGENNAYFIELQDQATHSRRDRLPPLQYSWASLVIQLVKNLLAKKKKKKKESTCNAGTWVQSLDWENPLEKGTGHKESNKTERLSLHFIELV